MPLDDTGGSGGGGGGIDCFRCRDSGLVTEPLTPSEARRMITELIPEEFDVADGSISDASRTFPCPECDAGRRMRKKMASNFERFENGGTLYRKGGQVRRSSNDVLPWREFTLGVMVGIWLVWVASKVVGSLS